MNNVLSYRGYSALVEFDAEDRIFFGRLSGINDGIGFHADTVDGLVAAFEEAVDDYINVCDRIGKKPEKPYSGKVMFRIDPALHARASLAAQSAGKSLNQWGAEALRQAAERQSGSPGSA